MLPKTYNRLALAVALALGLTCSAALPKAVAAPVKPVKTVSKLPKTTSADDFQADTDDSDELLYQWQNIKYASDEQRQMGEILVLFGAMTLLNIARREGAERRRRRTESHKA